MHLHVHDWRCNYEFIHVMRMYLVTGHGRASEPSGNLEAAVD